MIIKEQDLRQAIREGLAEARIDSNKSGFLETVIMMRVKDYQLQPISMTPELKACLSKLSST